MKKDIGGPSAALRMTGFFRSLSRDAEAPLLHAHQFPFHRSILAEAQPGVAGGGAAIGAGDAAGIEEADAADGLVAWDVGVAVEEELGAGGCDAGRDVLEMKAVAGEVEIEGERPGGALVAVAAPRVRRGFNFGYSTLIPPFETNIALASNSIGSFLPLIHCSFLPEASSWTSKCDLTMGAFRNCCV